MGILKTRSFPAPGVRSLTWRGDELVDWVGGGRAFSLDGQERPRHVNYAYRFDAATASSDGRFAVIYERLGTKALLLDAGEILRELNRSYYFANAYEYPVSFVRTAAGRLLLAHCPENYCQLELEDVETGERLTASVDRRPADFFHSRLSASPSGRRILSAGWIWHPWDEVVTFDIAAALAEPWRLDRGERAEQSSNSRHAAACWLDDDQLVLSGAADEENLAADGLPDEGMRLPPRGLAIVDVAKRRCTRVLEFEEPPGAIFSVGPAHILSLYRHPKLINLETGATLQTWSELNSGIQESSIIGHLKDEARSPPMAFEPISRRFAIANGNVVTIIDFSDLAPRPQDDAR